MKPKPKVTVRFQVLRFLKFEDLENGVSAVWSVNFKPSKKTAQCPHPVRVILRASYIINTIRLLQSESSAQPKPAR